MDASKKTLPDLLPLFLKQWPDNLSGHCHFELGLSGGLDSIVLLDLLCRAKEYQPCLHVTAVHVHHGLSHFADRWADFCAAWAQQYAISVQICRVEVKPKGGQSLEAVARQVRYNAYRSSDAAVIVLAHHQDDQSETTMLQLLRGGGVHALAGMPILRPLQDKWLWRPLLGFTRKQLESYAVERGLVWVEDESNQDVRWRRNLLRQQIFPLIEQKIPHYRAHLSRSAALLADAAAIVDEVAAADLRTCVVEGGLDVLQFRQLSDARQRFLLSHWITVLGWSVPEPAALLEFQHQLLLARETTQPELQLSQGVMYRYRNVIGVVPHVLPWSKCHVPWAGDINDYTGGWPGCLSWVEADYGLDMAALQPEFVLRPRVGGELLSQKVGMKPVKKLLQEAGVPPVLRSVWPLLYSTAGELLAIPGIAVSHRYAVQPGLWPQWQMPTIQVK